jgi:hypothetical protein
MCQGAISKWPHRKRAGRARGHAAFPQRACASRAPGPGRMKGMRSAAPGAVAGEGAFASARTRSCLMAEASAARREASRSIGIGGGARYGRQRGRRGAREPVARRGLHEGRRTLRRCPLDGDSSLDTDAGTWPALLSSCAGVRDVAATQAGEQHRHLCGSGAGPDSAADPPGFHALAQLRSGTAAAPAAHSTQRCGASFPARSNSAQRAANRRSCI